MQHDYSICRLPQDYLSKSDTFCRVWVNEKRAHKTQVCSKSRRCDTNCCLLHDVIRCFRKDDHG